MAQPSEQFSGDMSRNEVEIDLNKFMAMVSEIGELKENIRQLENDKEPDNPWQKAIWFSQMIDSWRIFPRMFLSVYMYLLYYCREVLVMLSRIKLSKNPLLRITKWRMITL